MILAGVPVSAALVSDLVALLDDSEPLQRKLAFALQGETAIVQLTVQERVTLIGALDDNPPAPLESLRHTLLDELRERDTRAKRASTNLPPSTRDDA